MGPTQPTCVPYAVPPLRLINFSAEIGFFALVKMVWLPEYSACYQNAKPCYTDI